MKNTLRLILGGLVAVAFSVCAQAADLVAGAYSANQVVGDVTCKLPGATDFVPVVNGKVLPQGAVIKTGPESTVSIEFSTGATALVRPNTQIEVTKFEQALFSGGAGGTEEPSVSSTKLMLLSGEVVSNVKKLKMGSEYTVNTPIGSAGVRGTFFSVSYDPVKKRLTVSTLLGKVDVVLPNGTVIEAANANEQVILEGEKGYKIPLDRKTRDILRGLLTLLVGGPKAAEIIKIIETAQIGVSIN